MKLIATTLLISGGFICCLNFYLSFLRYPLHRWAGKKKDEYRWSSGVPLLGSLFVLLSLLARWQTPWISIVSILLILIDTGGIHWFAATMIYQTFFKKNKSSPKT